MGIPETEYEASEAETVIPELIEENFPELKNEVDLKMKKPHSVSLKFNEKKATCRHSLVTFKFQAYRKNFASIQRKVTYKAGKVRLTSDFSLTILNTSRQWNNTYRVLKENNFEPRIIYPSKLVFVYEDNWKIFSDTKGLRKYIDKEPSLKMLLNDLLLPTKILHKIGI